MKGAVGKWKAQKNVNLFNFAVIKILALKGLGPMVVQVPKEITETIPSPFRAVDFVDVKQKFISLRVVFDFGCFNFSADFNHTRSWKDSSLRDKNFI